MSGLRRQPVPSAIDPDHSCFLEVQDRCAQNNEDAKLARYGGTLMLGECLVEQKPVDDRRPREQFDLLVYRRLQFRIGFVRCSQTPTRTTVSPAKGESMKRTPREQGCIDLATRMTATVGER